MTSTMNYTLGCCSGEKALSHHPCCPSDNCRISRVPTRMLPGNRSPTGRRTRKHCPPTSDKRQRIGPKSGDGTGLDSVWACSTGSPLVVFPANSFRCAYWGEYSMTTCGDRGAASANTVLANNGASVGSQSMEFPTDSPSPGHYRSRLGLVSMMFPPWNTTLCFRAWH